MSSNAPPPPNPVLSAYENFVRETPLVTRYILMGQAISWILSFLIDFSYAIANTAHFTIFKFELYRIVLSPFVCTSLMSLVFAYISFVDHGRRLEFSQGSTAFAALLLTIAVVTNLAHLAVCFTLYALSGNRGYLFTPSIGIWIILFAVIAIECAKAPQNSMRKLFFFNIPTIYYPLALFCLFSIFGGFQISYILSMAVGYAYGNGFLDRLKIGGSRSKQWEDSILANFAGREGWVISNDAAGSGAWTETGESSAGGGFNLFSQLAGQQQPQQQPAQGAGAGDAANLGDPRPGRAITTPSADSTGTPFPPSGGRALGSATRRTNADPRQARLQAIESRSGATGSDDQV